MHENRFSVNSKNFSPSKTIIALLKVKKHKSNALIHLHHSWIILCAHLILISAIYIFCFAVERHVHEHERM